MTDRKVTPAAEVIRQRAEEAEKRRLRGQREAATATDPVRALAMNPRTPGATADARWRHALVRAESEWASRGWRVSTRTDRATLGNTRTRIVNTAAGIGCVDRHLVILENGDRAAFDEADVRAAFDYAERRTRR